MENFSSSKPAEFYLKGINKQPDKWQEVIQNNGKYTTDWNSLLHCSWINYIQLKRKLFMNQPNRFYKFSKNKIKKINKHPLDLVSN